MIEAVSVIVVGQSPHLQEAVDSALRQTRPASHVLVVEDRDHALSQTTRAALAAKGVDVVHAPRAESPGQIRNAGVMGCRSPWVVLLDSSDLLDPSYLEHTHATAKSTSASFVTTGSRIPGGVEVRPPVAIALADVVAQPDLVHSASLIRREAWSAVGGFDEVLPMLISQDFWLRLLEAGFVGAAVVEPLFVARSIELRRGAARDVALRSSLELLIKRHRPLFVDHLPSIVCGRDRRLEDARTASQRLNTLCAEAGSALGTLRARVDAVSASLRQAGRDRVEFGDFNRVTPISSEWGADRGRCVDRYYIEQFLETHARDIRGRVLEVHDDDYTRQYGGERVTHSDVIDIDPMNRRATVVDDLRNARSIPSHSYDCFIMTQTLHVIYDMRAVLAEAARVVAPGGVVLATLACASRLAPEQGLDGDFWRFTAAAARRLFGEFFTRESLEVRSYGNVIVNIAYLYGLACHELSEAEFEAHDPYFPLIIGVRAQL